MLRLPSLPPYSLHRPNPRQSNLLRQNRQRRPKLLHRLSPLHLKHPQRPLRQQNLPHQLKRLHLQNLPHRPSRMHLQKLRFQLNQPRLQNPQHRQKPQRLPSLPLRQSL